MISGEGTRYARQGCSLDHVTECGHSRTSVDVMSQHSDSEMVTWLRCMKWDWFVTLTARRASTVGGSEVRTKRAALEWMEAVRARSPKAYAVVAVECGAHLGGWHAHILIGGLGTHPTWSASLERLWTHGHALAVRYDPDLDPKRDVRRGVVPYLHKDAPVEIVGRLKKWRPRRRA